MSLHEKKTSSNVIEDVNMDNASNGITNYFVAGC